jgi:outer membrane protein TolC
MMTMNAIMVAQRLPFPGKLSSARQSAELEAAAAALRLDAVRRDVIADVRRAYFDLVFLDRSLDVLHANRTLVVTLTQVTESRYSVGRGGQQDVLRANVEAARIGEEAVAVRESRRAALARLNALLDRPGDTPVLEPRVPDRIARAAVDADPPRIRFTSDELGASAADSPIPPLAVLQQRAARNNPALHAHGAMIGAQAARVDLARRAHLPDLDVSVQYGQRPGRTDMASVMVTVPLPVRRASRQGQQVAEAEAELLALQAEYDEAVNALRADVAQVYAELERTRTQLALFVQSIIPQGRAALESATTAFQVDRADFLTVLDNETTLFNYEIAYHRALADFARSVAELERLVGAEVLP